MRNSIFKTPSSLEILYGKGVKETYMVHPFGGVDEFPSYVYPLSDENLQIIPEDCPYGTYRIGYVHCDKFFVRYIGRSDHHEGGLRARVAEHVGKFEGEPYFTFYEAGSAREAYENECKDFHGFYEGEDGFLINHIHPAKPAEENTLHCPILMCEK
mgnify:CR=1 FL=1